MAPVTVRAALATDEAMLIEGNLALALETEALRLEPSVLQEGVRTVLRSSVGAEYFVAIDTHTGSVVGQLMVTTEWSDWRNRFIWWIQSVYVWPHARRSGVYRALYETVRQRAVSADAAGLRLYVDRTNARAQSVYAGMGMNGDHYRVFEAMFANEDP